MAFLFKMNQSLFRFVYIVKAFKKEKGDGGLKSQFNEYITRYNADLTRLCVSLCGNISDAEDLLQDTWLKAMRHYQNYDKSKPFDKWLYCICVNTYKNTLSSAFYKKRRFFNSDEEERVFFNSISEISSSTRDDYFELHRAISSLNKKHRIVIVLYYFKDYSITEISQIINIPTGTVKSRLSKARAELKRRLTHE